MDDLNDTIRRFPRTLQEAFKASEGYADSIEPPEPPWWRLHPLEWHTLLTLAIGVLGAYFVL